MTPDTKISLSRTSLLPGLPAASYSIWRWASVNDVLDAMRVELTPQSDETSSSTVRLIILNERTIARYTVYRHPTGIERNLFWFPPQNTELAGTDEIASVGVAGDVLQDYLRVLSEKIRLFFLYYFKDASTIWREIHYLPGPTGVKGSLEVCLLHEAAHISVLGRDEVSATATSEQSPTNHGLRKLAATFTSSVREPPHDKVDSLVLYDADPYLDCNATMDELLHAHSITHSFGSFRSSVVDFACDWDRSKVDWQYRFLECSRFIAASSPFLQKLTSTGQPLAPSDRPTPQWLAHGLLLLVETNQSMFGSWDGLLDTMRAYDRVLSDYAVSSPVIAVSLFNALMLALPIINPRRIADVFLISLRQLVECTYDLKHPDDVLALAVRLSEHLDGEVRKIKDRSQDYDTWKVCLFSLLPHLLVGYRLFGTAKDLFKSRGLSSEAEECTARQLILEEWYCDSWAALQFDGVAHQPILPFAEIAFIDDEPFPDCDIASYERAMNVIEGSFATRLLMPRFVFCALRQVLTELRDRAAAQNALHAARPPRGSYNHVRKLEMADPPISRRELRERRLQHTRDVLRDNVVFKKLIRPHTKLAQYLENGVREKLECGQRFDSSIGWQSILMRHREMSDASASKG